jgi:hypothetical protein
MGGGGICSSVTSGFLRPTRRHNSEDGIVHSYGRENWNPMKTKNANNGRRRCIYVYRSRWSGHVARMGERRNVYRVIGGKARGRETARKTKT